MYKNSKAAVKGKIDLTRKTDGGGMICLSQSEEVMANHLQVFNARQLNGVPEGFECGAAAKDEHGVVEESGWSSLLENMDTDIIRNVIDYHPSEADICKPNTPLEDAVGDCDVPSTSGFVPSKGKMSRRKRKSDAGDQLFQLEEKRLTAETAAFYAQ
ncbi:hypothetical protein MAR_017565 [Mya arenaria]|uniref:Uncharacterized protein n=1 Tax=Mya arenaria TaxID=6604 RepID=A0ABY7EFB6_MYAAR|nr:hypothetical protein MAR_017565 [Mya arenaria]